MACCHSSGQVGPPVQCAPRPPGQSVRRRAGFVWCGCCQPRLRHSPTTACSVFVLLVLAVSCTTDNTGVSSAAGLELQPAVPCAGRTPDRQTDTHMTLCQGLPAALDWSMRPFNWMGCSALAACLLVAGARAACCASDSSGGRGEEEVIVGGCLLACLPRSDPSGCLAWVSLHIFLPSLGPLNITSSGILCCRHLSLCGPPTTKTTLELSVLPVACTLVSPQLPICCCPSIAAPIIATCQRERRAPHPLAPSIRPVSSVTQCCSVSRTPVLFRFCYCCLPAGIRPVLQLRH